VPLATLGWRWVFWASVPFSLAAVVIGWLVIPQTADRGFDWRRAEIIGAGANVLPRYIGQAKIAFDTEQLTDGLLECVIYFGDNNKEYRQAFLYHQQPAQNDAIRLSELAPPRYNTVCP
jgi:MFS family permease